MTQKLARLLSSKKQVWIIPLYGFLYIMAFRALELRLPATADVYMIHSLLDDRIPFCEYFIVFYIGWFFYMAAALIYLIFFDRDPLHFHFLCLYLGLGMTVFLVVSWFWPNGVSLRPEVFPRDNIFTDAVRVLYRMDTSTNVMPSIHVYNSMAVFLSLRTTPFFRKKKRARTLLGLTALLIILSTAFLKQHSIYDILAGLLLSFLFYTLLCHLQRRVRALV